MTDNGKKEKTQAQWVNAQDVFKELREGYIARSPSEGHNFTRLVQRRFNEILNSKEALPQELQEKLNNDEAFSEYLLEQASFLEGDGSIRAVDVIKQSGNKIEVNASFKEAFKEYIVEMLEEEFSQNRLNHQSNNLKRDRWRHKDSVPKYFEEDYQAEIDELILGGQLTFITGVFAKKIRKKKGRVLPAQITKNSVKSQHLPYFADAVAWYFLDKNAQRIIGDVKLENVERKKEKYKDSKLVQSNRLTEDQLAILYKSSAFQIQALIEDWCAVHGKSPQEYLPSKDEIRTGKFKGKTTTTDHMSGVVEALKWYEEMTWSYKPMFDFSQEDIPSFENLRSQKKVLNVQRKNEEQKADKERRSASASAALERFKNQENRKPINIQSRLSPGDYQIFKTVLSDDFVFNAMQNIAFANYTELAINSSHQLSKAEMTPSDFYILKSLLEKRNKSLTNGKNKKQYYPVDLYLKHDVYVKFRSVMRDANHTKVAKYLGGGVEQNVMVGQLMAGGKASRELVSYINKNIDKIVENFLGDNGTKGENDQELKDGEVEAAAQGPLDAVMFEAKHLPATNHYDFLIKTGRSDDIVNAIQNYSFIKGFETKVKKPADLDGKLSSQDFEALKYVTRKIYGRSTGASNETHSLVTHLPHDQFKVLASMEKKDFKKKMEEIFGEGKVPPQFSLIRNISEAQFMTVSSSFDQGENTQESTTETVKKVTESNTGQEEKAPEGLQTLMGLDDVGKAFQAAEIAIRADEAKKSATVIADLKKELEETKQNLAKLQKLVKSEAEKVKLLEANSVDKPKLIKSLQALFRTKIGKRVTEFFTPPSQEQDIDRLEMAADSMTGKPELYKEIAGDDEVSNAFISTLEIAQNELPDEMKGKLKQVANDFVAFQKEFSKA